MACSIAKKELQVNNDCVRERVRCNNNVQFMKSCMLRNAKNDSVLQRFHARVKMRIYVVVVMTHTRFNYAEFVKSN